MSIKKILAAASASVLAVSAVSVMASAEAGEWAVGYADSWTTSNESGLPSGLTVDILKASESITFTATDCSAWGIGVDKTSGWYQTDSAEGAWLTDGSITINTSELNFDKGDSFCLKLCVNAAGDNGKITWETKAAAAAPADSTAATDTTTTGTDTKTNADTGVEGVAAVLGVAAVAAGAMIVAKKRK